MNKRIKKKLKKRLGYKRYNTYNMYVVSWAKRINTTLRFYE